jgi:hypothetical protein
MNDSLLPMEAGDRPDDGPARGPSQLVSFSGEIIGPGRRAEIEAVQNDFQLSLRRQSVFFCPPEVGLADEDQPVGEPRVPSFQENIQPAQKGISIVEIVDTVKSMDDRRDPGQAGRGPAVEPGHPAVRVKDVDFPFFEDRSDLLPGAGMKFFIKGSPDDGDAFLPRLLSQGAFSSRTNENFEQTSVQVLGQEKERSRPAAEDRLVDHLHDAQLLHVLNPLPHRI